jgi:MFS family permease
MVEANLRPKIVFHLGSVEKWPLLTSAYFLAATTSYVLWMQLCRTFNTKAIFCAALVVYAVGFASTGSASSLAIVVIGRAISGLGGAGLYAGTSTFVNVLEGEHEREWWRLLSGFFFGVGGV